MSPRFRIGPAAVTLFALGVVLVTWAWSDQLGDLGGDSAVYMMTARDIVPHGPPDTVAHAVAVESQFPPLYPALLAATGSARDPARAHLVTALCLLAALVALYEWLRALELDGRVALAVVALFALAPGTLLQSLQIKSESLYLALSLAGLARLARGRAGLATMAFAAALLTRSAGLALLPALLAAVARGRPRREYALPVAMVLPAVLWALYRSGQETYAATLRGLAASSPAEVARELGVHAGAIGRGLAQNLVQPQGLAWGLLPLFALAALTLVRRLREWRPDAWYVLAYLAMLVIWPYPSEARRLSWVIVPLLLAYAALGSTRFSLGSREARVPAWLAPAVLALLMAPALATFAQRRLEAVAQDEAALAQLPEWYGADRAAAQREARAHRELAGALASLGSDIPAGECVLSIKPVTVAYYTDRDGFVPPFETAGAASFEAWAGAPRCRYLLLMDATQPPQFASPYYPRDRLGARLEILSVRASESDPRHHVVAALARLKP